MRRWPRLALVVGLVLVMMVAPGVGLAGGPPDPFKAASGSSAVTLPGGVALPTPAQVPGTTMGALGMSDVAAMDWAAGASLVFENPGVLSVYTSAGNMTAPLGLPAGATLWRVDVFGYTSGATTQTWWLEDFNPATGTYTYPTYLDSGVGPGVVQTTMTFASGIQLANGHEWYLISADVGSAASSFVGAVFQYTLPTLSLVPITPVRVFDSRFSSRVTQGAPRTINVKDAINPATGGVSVFNAIPQGARAVSFTVTVASTANAGYVAVLPGTTTSVTASTINWTASGMTLATGGLVTLGTGAAERQVTLVVGGAGSASTDVILDITGYYK